LIYRGYIEVCVFFKVLFIHYSRGVLFGTIFSAGLFSRGDHLLVILDGQALNPHDWRTRQTWRTRDALTILLVFYSAVVVDIGRLRRPPTAKLLVLAPSRPVRRQGLGVYPRTRRKPVDRARKGWKLTAARSFNNVWSDAPMHDTGRQRTRWPIYLTLRHFFQQCHELCPRKTRLHPSNHGPYALSLDMIELRTDNVFTPFIYIFIHRNYGSMKEKTTSILNFFHICV